MNDELDEADVIDAFNLPVVTAGSGTAIHAPATDRLPGPACHDYGFYWGRVVEYEIIRGWRDWCQCAECQAYKEAIEADVGKKELQQPRTELLQEVVAQGVGRSERVTSP